MTPTIQPDPIAKSRQTLAAWTSLSDISGRPDEAIRLLQSEVHALETLALEHPRNAPAAAQLIAAYQALAAKMRKRALGPRPATTARRVA